jgi:hypothetical protein
MKMAGMESHPNVAIQMTETPSRMNLGLLSANEKDLNFRLSRAIFETINQGRTRQMV